MKIHQYNEMMRYLTRPKEDPIFKQYLQGGRVGMKPGGIVEPGVTQLVQPNLDGSRPGYSGLPLTKQFPKLETRAIELLNQGLPMHEVSDTLEAEGIIKIKTQPRAGSPGVMKKNYSAFNNFYKRLLKDKKLNITEIATKISGVPFSKEVWLQRENAVIEAFKKNPNLSAQQISKLVSTELGQQVSYTAVANALRRAGIDYQGRDQKLLPDIKKLDKIIKNNTAFLSTKGSLNDKAKFLFEEFKKVTKNKNLDMDKFSYRLERVGNMYAGTGVDRTVEKIYKSIKAPKNYLESGLHRNMVGMLDQFTKGIVGKAKLLGLPQKDIDLLSDVTKGAKSLSKISMAGDHTDIDGLMKNFSNYRKNFMRINMISHQLNAFKSASDKAIIKLHDEAVALQKSNHPNAAVRRKEILKDIATIRKNFKTKTGLNIGGFEFDAKGNPIMKKFETQRLGDLKNPRNKAILNAMNNLVKQSGVKFKGVDQELMFANTVKERFNILKNAGIDQLKKSKYIKAFAQMSGDVGKAANTLLKTKTGKIGAGVGIYGLLSSIASASEKDVDEVVKAGSMLPEAAAGAGAAGLAYKYRKPIMKGVGKALALAAVPLELGFMGAEAEQGKSPLEVIASPLMLQGTARENRIRNIMGDDSYQKFLQYHRSEADPVFYGEGEMTEKRLDPNLEKLRAMAVARVQQEDDARKEATRQFNLRSDETMFKSGGKVDYYDNYLPDPDNDDK